MKSPSKPIPMSAGMILYCDRWKETVRFYRDILKLAVTCENNWLVEFELTKSSRLGIADAGRTSLSSANGDGITLTLQVDDIDRAHRFFQDAGVEVTGIKSIWDARSFFIYDPEGHRIEFWG